MDHSAMATNTFGNMQNGEPMEVECPCMLDISQEGMWFGVENWQVDGPIEVELRHHFWEEFRVQP